MWKTMRMKCHHDVADLWKTADMKRWVIDENGERMRAQEIVIMPAKWRWVVGIENHDTEKRICEILVLDKSRMVAVDNGSSVGTSGVDGSEMLFSWTTGPSD